MGLHGARHTTFGVYGLGRDKPNCSDTTGGRDALGSGVEATGEPAEVLIPRFEDIGKQKKRDQGKLTMGFAFVRFDSALGARPAIPNRAKD